MENILKAYKNEIEFTGYDKNYFIRVKNFLLYLDANDISYTNITYNILVEYLNHLKTNHTTGTVNNYIKSVKHFAEFLNKINKIPESTLNMISNFHYLKVDRKHPGYYSVNELAKIVDTAKICMDWIIPEKSEAVIWFMFYTGIRKREFLDLKRKEIDLENNVVTILAPKAVRRMKETKQFKFPKSVANLVKAYYAKDPEEKINAFNMSLGQMNYFFKDLKESCPTGKFNPHMLRYSYANNLHKNGLTVRHIQKLMGHRSLSSTLLYVDPDLQDCFDKYDEKIDGKTEQKKIARRKTK